MKRLLLTAALSAFATIAAAETTVGNLTLDGAFARATLPNAPVAGGYVTITNTGATDDTLIAAESTFAGMTEIHEMAMEGEVMKMRPLPDGLPIPAGATVMLQPGGFHLMFMNLKDPLTEGDTVNVTLTFEKAGPVALDLIVAASNAKEMPEASQ